jgi:NAD(P)-dependent dehydrogenase (short-subunit alcohol dehydrogenase family)
MGLTCGGRHPHSDPMSCHRGAAVVTGAARGLGQAIATALHQIGYDVMVTDTDPDAAAEAAAPLGGWSARLDTRHEQACEVAAERAAERGGLALWVNTADMLADGPSWTQDGGMRRRLMDAGAVGVMNGTLAALGVMKPRGRGHIVNVVAGPGGTVSTAIRQAAVAFSLGTRADLRDAGQRGVQISCLCPGPVPPDGVALRVVRLLDDPRPIVAMPRWRGAPLRVGALLLS